MVERVTSELRAIMEALASITGMPTHWSGRLILDDRLDARGIKPYNCDIVLRSDMCDSDERWRTLIHEALHCFSVGYRPADYMAHRGWEEGVVEQLQRVLRADVMADVGVEFDAAAWSAVEDDHPYNRYIASLEAIRRSVGAQERGFYLDLLSRPIRDRHGRVLEVAMDLEGEARRGALVEISRHRDMLDGRSR